MMLKILRYGSLLAAGVGLMGGVAPTLGQGRIGDPVPSQEVSRAGDEGDPTAPRRISGRIDQVREYGSLLSIGDVSAVVTDRTVIRDARGRQVGRNALRPGQRAEVTYESLPGHRVRLLTVDLD
ncbi:hypothetical protein [Ectothiorhodospira mobilis]|uniref:hypothetical protein n=1 Tax=Ectothiorhodospira mobilis TaxID=195064 RepID=UPI001EE976AB|nr:hypothetical protein [Ectothiorhodospira mobilis]MCG5534644.1 hypothetical protein [Ectothiorhodospira mobilis]